MKPLFIDIGLTERKLIHIKKVDAAFLDKPFHFHPNCELVYIEEGFGKRVIGDNVSNFSENDIVLMGPNMPHIWRNDDTFYKGDKRLRSKAVVIYFSPDLLSSLLPNEDLDSVRALIKRSLRGIDFGQGVNENIMEKLAGLTSKKGLPQLIDFLSILSMLAQAREFRYISSEKFINTFNERDTDRINNVYHYLMQHFKEDIELEEVSRIACMAPTAFCRFFKQRTQKTFSRFINELRIGHACELLYHPEKSIAEISSESGYHNMTNFNKFFREITGSTPTVYRKKLQ